MIEQLQEWYENRHEYAKSYKEKTGRKIVGFFCTYSPEEIYYAFDHNRRCNKHEQPA